MGRSFSILRYDYGAVKARISKSVPRKGAMALLTQADPKDLVPAKPFCEPPSLDGAEWLIERNDGTGTYFAERFSPRCGPIHDIGVALLRVSGLEPKAEETY